MQYVRFSRVFAISILAFVHSVCCNNGASKAPSPCTLSYFDLWKDAGLIFTSEIHSLGWDNKTCKVKIDGLLKYTDSRENTLPIKRGQIFNFPEHLNNFYCDGKFRIGQTRLVFAAFDKSSRIRILRAPKLRSWLLVLLRSINAEGKKASSPFHDMSGR